jgi:hypothetical protein
MKKPLYQITYRQVDSRLRDFKKLAEFLEAHGFSYGALEIREFIRDNADFEREEEIENLRDFLEVSERYYNGEMSDAMYSIAHANYVAYCTHGSEQVVIKEVKVNIRSANLSLSESVMQLPKPLAASANSIIDIEMQICDLLCELYQYSDDEVFVTAVIN